MKRITTLLILIVSLTGFVIVKPCSTFASFHSGYLNINPANSFADGTSDYLWSWPQCRNTSGGSPEQPSSVFLGDNATFGHDSWSTVDGNWPKWRVLIHTGSDINNGIAGSWSSTSNIEHKTATSARFTSTGSWYWGFEVDYSTDGSKWYCQNNSSWSNMWGSPTSNLTITVSALNNPAFGSATLGGTNAAPTIALSWAKDGQDHNVMILRKKSTASWTEPTQGHAYIVGDTIGAATVIYNGSGTTFTDNVNSSTSYDYKFYSENWSYYSSGVQSTSTITTNTNTTDYFRSKQTGDWNSTSCWESSYDNAFWINATSIPGISCKSAVIHDTHIITLTDTATVKDLSIRNGGTFNLGSNTLTIAAKGSLSNNTGGTFNSGTGKVYYYGDGSVGNYATFWGTLNFYNVEIQNGGINFGSASTISGSLTIKNFGWIETNAPAYSSGSTLVYNTGGAYTVTTEWNSPYNVTVTNNTEIDFSGALDRYILANLLIESGCKVKLSSTNGADLYIKGNFTNNGTFDSNSREVIFEGTATQEIIGNSATTFSYLRINNPAGIVVNSPETVTVTDRLAIDTGVVSINPLRSLTVSGLTENNTTDACILVKSDVTGTGSLIHNTAGIEGTIQRYITGSTDPHAMMYHFVSVPMDTANFSYSGMFEGSYLFYFREDTNYWKGLGSPLYTPLDETRGYLVYYILGDNITYSFEGNMNYTAFTPHLESHVTSPTDNNHGWNLVPNPFPCAIDWNELNWTKTNIDTTIYFWDATSSAYKTWNGHVGTGSPTATRYIPSGQSFFVHSNNTTSEITIPATARVHNTQTYYKNGEEIVPNVLRLYCTDNLKTDDIIVHFRQDATNEFDTHCDAYKLSGGIKVPQLSTITSDGYKAAINSLPLASGQQVIPVNLNYYQPAQLTFTASGMELFEHQPTIFLEDKLENKLINLYEQPEYTFDYSTNDTARFNLVFTDFTNIEKPATSSFIAYQQEDRIRILYPEIKGEKAAVRLYDMTGKMVSSTEAVFGEIIDVKAPETQGVYIIQVVNKDKTNSRKVVIL